MKFTNILFIGKTNAGKSSLFNKIVEENASIVNEKENMTIDLVMRTHENINFFDSPGMSSLDDIDVMIQKVPHIDILCIIIPYNDHIDKFYTNIIKKYCNKYHICIIHTKSDLSSYDTRYNIPNVDNFHVSIYNYKSIKDLRKYLLQQSKSKIYIDKDEALLSNVTLQSTQSSTSKAHHNVEFCIFGRSNVGKSTIANAILGYNRFVVRDEIGTTLEINHSVLENDHMRIILSDTPGYRKNNNIDKLSLLSQDKVEDHMNQTWYHNHICCVVISAVDGLTSTDQKIINKVLQSFVVLIVVNKSDLVTCERLQYILNEIDIKYPMIQSVCVSALMSYDMKQLKKMLYKLIDSAKFEIKTSSLNKWIQSLNMNFVKYAVHIQGIHCKLFVKKIPKKNEQMYIARSFCQWFNLQNIKPNLEFLIS